ncbi:hypothetical protein FOG50_01821 [Hanseniaspora uvarum]|nr:hypothetical protein FOG50_01821 [Hanseniaspora uvarum]
MKVEKTKKNSKYSRRRRILSCFRCRYLRNKCDRAKPRCGRCVENNCEKCEYMSDNGTREEYIKHLESNGHKDNRIKLENDCPNRKVRFEVPATSPKSVKKPISNEITKLLYRTAIDLKTPLNKENLSYISILDKSIKKKSTMSEVDDKKLSLKYTAEIFSDGERIVNKLFVKNRTPGSDEPLKYQITAQSSLCLDQIYLRLLPFQIKELWREMAFDYYQEIDFEKYGRLTAAKPSNSNFLDNWNSEKKNVFEELLNVLPKDFEVLRLIVFEFFNTELYKTFKILNEDEIKESFFSIFKFDKKTGNISQINLEDYQDQYYLGTIVLIFQLMVDPELYHDPIFQKVDDIVSEVKLDRYRNGYLKCQYYLLTLFKNEMHYKAAFSTNKRVINDLLSWAQEIEKNYKDNDVLDPKEQEIINNTWYWIMYFEVLAYIEIGISPRFNYHFINDKTLNKCERGRIPLMKKLAFLVGKIALACEHPSFNPDIEYLCGEIDDFIKRNLAPIDYYMDTEKSKKVDAFDFNILNPLLSLKLSLWSYKYALTTEEKEYSDMKNKLYGLCFVARTIFYTQQSKIIFEIENIKDINAYSFNNHLKSLKKNEKLLENEQRPIWVPQLIAPNFMMFCSDLLYERAAALIEFIAFESLKHFYNSENRRVLNDEQTEEFAQRLNTALIHYALGKTDKFDFEYTPMDVILLHDKLVHLKLENNFKLPARIAYPRFILLEFVCVIKEILQKINVEDGEKFKYEHLLKAYENYKLAKKKLKKSDGKHLTENEENEANSAVTLFSPNTLDLNDLWSDMEDFDMLDFMKLLN